jgi:hypothetical protein
VLTVKYEYPGDPVLDAHLMFGAEFKHWRGPGYMRVGSVNADGEFVIDSEQVIEEAICDLCNKEVQDIDPCVLTVDRLYCWTCAEEWVLKHRLPAVALSTINELARHQR